MKRRPRRRVCPVFGFPLIDSFWRQFFFGEHTADYCVMCRCRHKVLV